MSQKAKILGRRNSAEQNKKVLERAAWNTDYFKKMREGIKRRHGIDLTDKKALVEGGRFPVLADGFSFKALESKLMEADASTSFTPLLRAGVQTLVNDMYHTIPTTFEEWAHVETSDKDEELYAPLQGIGFPQEVGKQEKYPESGAMGLDIKLKNRKYGELYPVEMELLMNDQTGQVKNQVALLAEYAKVVVEVIVYAKLASVSGGCSYAGLNVSASETAPSYESGYPWSTSLKGGGATKPSSFGAFSGANFQNALLALGGQMNLLGLKMAVQPNRLICGLAHKFDAATILNSAFYPSGAAAAGAVGGAFAKNVLQGITELTVSPYMFDNSGVIPAQSKAWYVVDDRRPWFIVQMREPASVIQENPEAGESFERDVVRHKLRIQCNADFIDPRFAYQGSDGSV